jgi:O-antigen/teichoic acid export membrane protein
LEEVAILTTGQQWRGMVLFATSVLASVAIPMMARMSESGDRAGVRKIHQLSLAANMLFGVGVVAVVGVATGPILAAYGKGFNGSHLVFWLMVASAVPMSYLNVLLQYLVSHGRMWLQLLQYGVSNAVLVIGYVISIAYWGSLGFAVTTLIVSAATALALDRWLREELAMGAAAECSSSGVAGSEQKLGKI